MTQIWIGTFVEDLVETEFFKNYVNNCSYNGNNTTLLPDYDNCSVDKVYIGTPPLRVIRL